MLLEAGNFDSSACPCPSCKRLLDSRSYQLAAMTSLYLAIKLRVTCEDNNNNEEDDFGFPCLSSSSQHHPQRKLTFRLEAFADLSRGQFVSQDIVEMEQQLLSAVRWRVHPPTPMLCVSYLLSTLLPNHHHHTSGRSSRFDLVLHVVRELSRYCTELAVCLGRDCSGEPASAVATAAILESMDLLTLAALPQELRDLFRRRAATIMPLPSLRLRATIRKALWPELLDSSSNSDQHAAAPESNTRHPISMARDFGLLDVERLYPVVAPQTVIGGSSPPLSPKRSLSSRHFQHEASPISVRR